MSLLDTRAVIWQELAACAGKTDLFFSDNTRDIEQAQQICDTCPVIADCTKLAATIPDGWPGIYAGQTPDDRAQPDRVNHGTVAGYRRHMRLGRAACRACRTAWADYMADTKRQHYGRGYIPMRARARQADGQCPGCASYKHHRHSTPCTCPKCP